MLGYPLPTLLRLSILILHTAPFKPVDILLSYSHLCLQNSTFMEFAPHFYRRAKVGQLLAASPLSMGLLTQCPPSWHPAPPGLLHAVSKARENWSDLTNLALGYSLRQTRAVGDNVPLVVGFSTPEEVHECVKVWREVSKGSDRQKREKEVCELFREAGYLDWSWASP